MLELLLKELKAFDGIEWLARRVKTRRLESYFVKKDREMLREAETSLIYLTIYVDFEEGGKKCKGSYATEIHPGSSAEEIRAKIAAGASAARFVKNERFPLVEPSAEKAQGASVDVNLEKSLANLEKAFFEADAHDEGRLSYAEIFVSKNEIRILNSRGVDISYETADMFAETAVHWKGSGSGEIEIYESFRASVSGDAEAACAMIKERLARLFEVARSKARAVPLAQAAYENVLLSGEALAIFFACLRSRANAQLVYERLSTMKAGDSLGDAPGDRISIALEPMMEGSSLSRRYDDDGRALEPCQIVKDGKVQRLWGDTRFSSYVGIEPSGAIGNMRVTGGASSAEELRREPHLELVSFSDFHAEPVTGDFGSEIRLGYYFDGQKTTPVTGGSISGNISAALSSMRMSAESAQYDGFIGPKTILIKGASISGAKG